MPSVEKYGDHVIVRLTVKLAEELGLKVGQEVKLRRQDEMLLISPVHRRRYRLADLLRACDGKENHPELITDRRGREIL